ANEDCKKLPKSLPNQNPILVEMTEVFNCIGTVEYKYEATAAAFAALKGPSGISGVCFGCGKPVHLKKDCFAQKGVKSKGPDVCPWCHKGRHFTNQCCSKY
ncbi:POK9 protein, partial [Pycnonotus jocosus]|nr:POK9 protein [Pycnonotus jocosus]